MELVLHRTAIGYTALSDKEKTELLEFVDKREKFVIKPIRYAAKLLNPSEKTAIECILNIVKSKLNIKSKGIF